MSVPLTKSVTSSVPTPASSSFRVMTFVPAVSMVSNVTTPVAVPDSAVSNLKVSAPSPPVRVSAPPLEAITSAPPPP